MWPFKPAWMGENKDKALKSVQKETDKAALKEIMQKASLSSVRMAALYKLDDQSTFADAAKNNSLYMVRATAVSKLSDQAIIADVANTDGNDEVCIAAVEVLSEQSALTAVAKAAKSWAVRRKALMRLTGAVIDLPPRCYNGDPDPYTDAEREEHYELNMAKALSDQSFLEDLAKNARYEFARKTAVEKLTEQSMLADIA